MNSGRRFVVTAAFIGVGLFTTTACSGTDTTPSGGGAGGPAAGGSVTIGATALTPGLGDPFSSSLSGNAVKNTLPAVFDRLTVPSPEGVEPALATSWAQGEDLLTWEFKLREGVNFSNGEPFDAEAVVASFTYLLEGEGQTSIIAGYFGSLEKVEAVDDLTVRFTTSTPNPALDRDVTQVFIVPPKYFAEVGPEEFAKNPVGTGPFQVESWTAEQIDLTRFADSWREASLDEVTFKALPDATARGQALQSGQIDLALSLPASLAGDLESRGLAYEPTPQGTVLAVQYVNTKDESPLHDVRVRQALNLAVDREGIIDSILLGHSKPANQGAVEGALGYDPTLESYPYDPDEARRLLAEAGVADGFKFLIQLSGEAGDTPDIMQAVASDLEAVGVTMDVQAIPFSQWLEKLKTNTFDGDAFSIGYTSQPDYNSLRAYRTVSCFNEPDFWCDEDSAALIEDAAAAESVTDLEEQMRALGTWTHENPPSLFILESVEFVGIGESVDSINFNAMGGLALDDVTASN